MKGWKAFLANIYGGYLNAFLRLKYDSVKNVQYLQQWFCTWDSSRETLWIIGFTKLNVASHSSWFRRTINDNQQTHYKDNVN